jgi:hypothetical protein
LPFTPNRRRDKVGLPGALQSLMDICVKSPCLGGRADPPAKKRLAARFDENQSSIERLLVECVVSE